MLSFLFISVCLDELVFHQFIQFYYVKIQLLFYLVNSIVTTMKMKKFEL